MNFVKNAHKIKNMAYMLSPHLGLWNPWTALGLIHIANKAYLFDTLTHYSPFYSNFFDKVNNSHYVNTENIDELAFTLFEDIIVFFREKNLLQPSYCNNNFELEMLMYFESCGQWSEFDGNLVSEWYWHHLPLMALKMQNEHFLIPIYTQNNELFSLQNIKI